MKPYLNLQPGDAVIASRNIVNDGSFPEAAEDEILVSAGRRGVIVNIGHLEHQEEQRIFLVQFENDSQELGPPIGCWPDDITNIPYNPI